jgi:hypothetical protein
MSFLKVSVSVLAVLEARTQHTAEGTRSLYRSGGTKKRSMLSSSEDVRRWEKVLNQPQSCNARVRRKVLS